MSIDVAIAYVQDLLQSVQMIKDPFKRKVLNDNLYLIKCKVEDIVMDQKMNKVSIFNKIIELWP